ncbi:TetR/AcrR family transcriptional regulator [Streptomyces sp. TRM66268-LWL]|uniref:TetR/AcrR family transcriptional regulator n=1 Tax=Streptomyces polyasparticus TaxID=2767826 RepID=A0ABR7SHN6_9ACTN|nr:TetR/AcrR family transcriptional regulator [Streptomyces polyasparticus]MBC9714933.1 TetR/AcrR family transcriptional regulator [Streptomyces polyasparticus]
MARVSQEHLDARRRQIMVGARRCFARNGFHATSMQDILKEVGLSAGAVYRYFSGKEELIEAIAEEAFSVLHDAFDEAARQSPPPLPDELLGYVLRQCFAGTGFDTEREFGQLVLQVWGETTRNEVLGAKVHAAVTMMRAGWTEVVKEYQRQGIMPDDVEPEYAARTLMGCAMGFIAQQALFGDLEIDQLQQGLRGVMRMQVTGAS